jgi:hypothetical protein
MRSILTLIALFTCSLVVTAPVFGQDSKWPRDLDIESGILTTYQPQVDKLEGDVLSFRAAVAYKEDDGSEPVFGAAWFESRVEIDRETRMVHMTHLEVTDMRFPEGSDWDVDFSLDALLTSLEASEEAIAAASNLNNDPPVIIYRDHPALLLYIDGDPIMREIENSEFQAVINTPYPLIYDGKKYYYLNAAQDVWYKAQSARIMRLKLWCPPNRPS